MKVKNIRNMPILLLYLLSLIIVCGGVCYCIYWLNSSYVIIETSDYEYEEKMIYLVEEINSNMEETIISGYAFIPDMDLEYLDTNIVLERNNVYYKLNTQLVVREDVTIKYNNINDLNNSGFKTQFKNSKFDKGTYRICLTYNDGKNLFVKTNEYVTIK